MLGGGGGGGVAARHDVQLAAEGVEGAAAQLGGAGQLYNPAMANGHWPSPFDLRGTHFMS